MGNHFVVGLGGCNGRVKMGVLHDTSCARCRMYPNKQTIEIGILPAARKECTQPLAQRNTFTSWNISLTSHSILDPISN